MDANEPVPIMCTLSPSDLEDRGAAWRKVLGSGLVERTRVPGGLRLVAAPGAATALMELIDLERECCAWIKFDVTGPGSVTLTADGAGRAVLAVMFRVL